MSAGQNQTTDEECSSQIPFFDINSQAEVELIYDDYILRCRMIIQDVLERPSEQVDEFVQWANEVTFDTAIKIDFVHDEPLTTVLNFFGYDPIAE